MTERELVRRVILGYTVLDRMQWEIGLLANLVFDYLRPYLKSEEGITFLEGCQRGADNEEEIVIQSDAVEWELSNLHYNTINKLTVRSVSDGRQMYLWADSGKSIEVSMRDVAQVYASLPFFLSDMVRRFPQLADSLQPYVQAADMR